MVETLSNTTGLKITYGFEPDRNLKTQVKNEFGGTIISQYDYQYDELGRRISVANSGTAFMAGGAGFNRYDYNDRSELTESARYLGTDIEDLQNPVDDEYRSYQYDPIGNRIEVVEADRARRYTSNNLNQYEAVATTGGGSGDANLIFDDDGNLVSVSGGDKNVSYTYNAENRLIAVEPISPAEGDKKVEFLYDYMGRRVKKAVYAYDGASWSLETEKLFVYYGWNLIAEQDGAGSANRYFVWGLDLSQSLQGAGGIGGLICAIDNSSGSSLTYHYLYDGNGNVGQVVSRADGDIVASYEYDPFGRIINADGAYAGANPFRFSTKYHGDKMRLVYYGYRYYSAELGRWISRDPIGEISGSNLYSFIENDGINLNDVLGLILFAFDGTGNNSERDWKIGKFTNVYILLLSYEGTAKYYPGPGSDPGTRIYGGATGAGAGNRLDDAYIDFEKYYEPESYSSGQIKATIDIIGFSRGAALAREFANVLANPKHSEFKGYKGCPVPIRFVGLFDTVDQTAFSDLNLKLPDLVEHAAQAVAADEKRKAFPVTLIDDSNANYDQKFFKGDHSDIGRGHGKGTNYLSLAPLFYIYSQGRAAGVPFGNLNENFYMQFNGSSEPHNLTETDWLWMLFDPVDRGYTGQEGGDYQ